MMGSCNKEVGRGTSNGPRLTTCDVFGRTLLQDVITKYVNVITKSISKILPTVSLRSRIKTRSSELAPPMKIKGQTLSASVEPSNPRMVKANWLGSKLVDLDKNLANVMRLEKCQQGFMETCGGFFNGVKGNRVLVLRDCHSPALCISTAGKG